VGCLVYGWRVNQSVETDGNSSHLDEIVITWRLWHGVARIFQFHQFRDHGFVLLKVHIITCQRRRCPWWILTLLHWAAD